MSNKADGKAGLAFSEEMQMAVIGWMIKEYSFATKCKQHLNVNLFIKTELSELYAAICLFMDKYKSTPSPEALRDFLADKQHFNIASTYLADCIAWTSKYHFKYIKDSIGDWIKISLFKASLNAGIVCLKTGDIDGIAREMHTLFNQANKASFGADGLYDLSTPVGDFQKMFENLKSDVTWGIKDFDELLGGGLIRGTQSVLLSPTNCGKTTVCINVAIHNILKGHDVLFLTHEDLDLNIMSKFRYNLLKMSKSEIYQKMYPAIDDQFFEDITRVNKLLIDHLIYVGKTKSFYVEDVVDEIRVRIEENYQEKGRYPSLMIDDYPAKLMSHKMKDFNDYRHGVKFAYNEFDHIAQEFNLHSLVPVQTNRAGYNRNRYRERGDEMLDAGDISESLGIAMDAANIISLNRSEEDSKHNRLYFKIVKTRNGPANSVIQTATDFKRAITHIDHPLLYKVVKGHIDQNLEDVLKREIETSVGANVNPDLDVEE